MEQNISTLITEQRNSESKHIDQLTTPEVLTLINDQDQMVAKAVQKVLPEVEEVVESVLQSLSNGGRLFYIGAGTSGRIGFVDAAECPPTFSVPSDWVQAIIAGGEKAIVQSIEGAEDDAEQGASDLKQRGVGKQDTVIGIAASGRTPYVRGALSFAKQMGATVVALSCNPQAMIGEHADHRIEVIVGPEVLTGSTRMKAATAHKMILNMITTTTMIKLGKVYENLMIDLQVSNDKLKKRAIQILKAATGISEEAAEQALYETGNRVKPAIVMIKAEVSLNMAEQALKKTNGFVQRAIEWLSVVEET